MPRSFPKFLYSNPLNTKSGGPFIVHTMQPKGIYKVIQTDDYPGFQLDVLQSDPFVEGLKISPVARAEEWFMNQPEAKSFLLNYQQKLMESSKNGKPTK